MEGKFYHVITPGNDRKGNNSIKVKRTTIGGGKRSLVRLFENIGASSQKKPQPAPGKKAYREQTLKGRKKIGPKKEKRESLEENQRCDNNPNDTLIAKDTHLF